ncbi:MAG: ribonuclease G [Spongiibacteraceae bacterium]|jgi:ribonuclease G|nr:ribonuclease G [Spongiibacteraceae bacterium]
MNEEILINITPMETRVALVDNGVLQEIYIERERSRGFVGNIYRGRVVRVLPGMQAAFVDVGLERACFLHASDIELTSEQATERGGDIPDIRELVREGQSLIVQVNKDPLGSKGARLTTHLSVSSRYLVYMPQTPHIGISQRIEDEAERLRLRALVEEVAIAEGLNDAGGFIIRTAAEGVGRDELLADVRFLKRLWTKLSERMTRPETPAMIYQDLPLFLRTMRDLVRPGLEKIRIDSPASYPRVVDFARDYIPEIVDRIELYRSERPLFDLYGIEAEIQKALGRKVELKSGGHLIIDQTEAMTTVDVNTGAFVGHRNLEETIFKTNLEAATALARQLRIRNLGGIIIIDFIDMKDPEHRRQVLRTLEKAMEKDYAKTSITGVSELGLVEMTRKRTRESLGHVLCEPCPVCQGRGSLKSPETVCYEIFREIMRDARTYDNDRLLVLASQAVVDRLLDEDSAIVADLEEHLGKTIQFQVEIMYSQEQFDVVLL